MAGVFVWPCGCFHKSTCWLDKNLQYLRGTFSLSLDYVFIVTVSAICCNVTTPSLCFTRWWNSKKQMLICVGWFHLHLHAQVNPSLTCNTQSKHNLFFLFCGSAHVNFMLMSTEYMCLPKACVFNVPISIHIYEPMTQCDSLKIIQGNNTIMFLSVTVIFAGNMVHHIHNTKEFIKVCELNLEIEVTVVSYDATSLVTCLPTAKATEYVRKYLKKDKTL